MINKVDRFLFEKKYDAKECYNQFQKVIAEINTIISTYQNDKLGKIISIFRFLLFCWTF